MGTTFHIVEPQPIFGSQEWRRENLGHYDCSVCLQSAIDPIEIRRFEVDSKDVCAQCVDWCPLCGEAYCDESPAELGQMVRYRQAEEDGKLSKPTHATCAAGWILGLMGDPRTRENDASSYDIMLDSRHGILMRFSIYRLDPNISFTPESPCART